MNRIEEFEKSYESSMSRIEECRRNPEYSVYTEWLLSTNANPYGFMDDKLARSMYTAEGFDGLISTIHHALYDDGDICFPVVNGRPSMAFCHKTEYKPVQVHYARENELKFLKTIEEFIDAVEEFERRMLKMSFIGDYNRRGDDIIGHYLKSPYFDEEWILEAKKTS